jgi:hypothetical protein
MTCQCPDSTTETTDKAKMKSSEELVVEIVKISQSAIERRDAVCGACRKKEERKIWKSRRECN